MNKILKWLNNNYIVKFLFATGIELGKLILKSTFIWLTGLFLISYLGNLPFMNFWQCILFTFWFKIIIFNLLKSKE